MQSLISICENFADEYNLKYNPSKCKVMIFSNSLNNNVRLVLNETLLSVSRSEKHLGHMMSSVGEILDYSSIINDIKVRSNCIKREFNYLDTNSKTSLFNAQCTRFYGCQLMDIQSNQFKELERSWRVSVRYLLGLEPRTHSVFLPGLTNSMSVSAQIHSRMLCFFKEGINHNEPYISFFFMNCISGTHSYSGRNINILLRQYGLIFRELKVNSTSWLKKKVKEHDIEPSWKVSVIRDLLLCRDGVRDCGFNLNEVNIMLRYICTC